MHPEKNLFTWTLLFFFLKIQKVSMSRVIDLSFEFARKEKDNGSR